MDPDVVADAILQGIKTAISSTPLFCLTDIRLVLFNINVFLASKEKAMELFPVAVINRDVTVHWDNMTPTETIKVVLLHPSSAEYQTVKRDFEQTVTNIVTKIERVQNIHLRRAYEAHKKQMSDKNKLEGGARERFLYHGTSRDNCSSIMNTGFNRSFAGQNAASYGEGTYFAVDASYSADPTYSTPAADGSQSVFLARVLTGTYTLGFSDMKMPPPHNDQQPDYRYDSLVDYLDNPSLYVVFHDSQAYPDYLITFI